MAACVDLHGSSVGRSRVQGTEPLKAPNASVLSSLTVHGLFTKVRYRYATTQEARVHM